MKRKQPLITITLIILIVLGLILSSLHNELVQAAGGGPTNSGNTSLYYYTATPASDGTISHTVLDGQNLYMIADLYGIKTEDLMQRNNLKWGDIIYPGDVLIIGRAGDLQIAAQADQQGTPPAGSTYLDNPQMVDLTATLQVVLTSRAQSTLYAANPGMYEATYAANRTATAYADGGRSLTLTSAADPNQQGTPLAGEPLSELTPTPLPGDGSKTGAQTDASAGPGLLARLFNPNNRFLFLGFLLFILLGLFLLVISSRRMRQ